MSFNYDYAVTTTAEHIFTVALDSPVQEVSAMFQAAAERARMLGIDTDDDWAIVSADDENIVVSYTTTAAVFDRDSAQSLGVDLSDDTGSDTGSSDSKFDIGVGGPIEDSTTVDIVKFTVHPK